MPNEPPNDQAARSLPVRFPNRLLVTEQPSFLDYTLNSNNLSDESYLEVNRVISNMEAGRLALQRNMSRRNLLNRRNVYNIFRRQVNRTENSPLHRRLSLGQNRFPPYPGNFRPVVEHPQHPPPGVRRTNSESNLGNPRQNEMLVPSPDLPRQVNSIHHHMYSRLSSSTEALTEINALRRNLAFRLLSNAMVSSQNNPVESQLDGNGNNSNNHHNSNNEGV